MYHHLDALAIIESPFARFTATLTDACLLNPD